ncbi:hypothetical protein E4T49_03762 [Aureobasidium sp. EXF-10728]|nr:hypothetical protein E4T49_03762 [Aureobasidium sp. EXF-10728]
MTKDSSHTYIHLHRSHHADLLEDFNRTHLPHEEIYVPPQHQPLNPDDEDDVVPEQHAAFGIQRATQRQQEPAWRDLANKSTAEDFHADMPTFTAILSKTPGKERQEIIEIQKAAIEEKQSAVEETKSGVDKIENQREGEDCGTTQDKAKMERDSRWNEYAAIHAELAKRGVDQDDSNSIEGATAKTRDGHDLLTFGEKYGAVIEKDQQTSLL